MGFKPTRWYSNKQENKVAKIVGGKTQPNSGATAFAKGDVASDSVLFECKTCTKPQQQQTVKKEWLIGIEREKNIERKEFGAVVIDFGSDQQYAIIKLEDLNKLLERYEEEL